MPQPESSPFQLDGGDSPLGESPTIPNLWHKEVPEDMEFSKEWASRQLPEVPRHSKITCSETEARAVLQALITRCRIKRAKWCHENPALVPRPEDKERTEEPGDKPGEQFLLNHNGRWARVFTDPVTGLDACEVFGFKPDNMSAEDRARHRRSNNRKKQREQTTAE